MGGRWGGRGSDKAGARDANERREFIVEPDYHGGKGYTVMVKGTNIVKSWQENRVDAERIAKYYNDLEKTKHVK